MNAIRFRSVLARHILRALAGAQREGRRVDLRQLSSELDVRRADVRSALSSLHEEGFVDVTRMRLTMRGFGLGTILASERLEPLRALPPFRMAGAAA